MGDKKYNQRNDQWLNREDDANHKKKNRRRNRRIVRRDRRGGKRETVVTCWTWVAGREGVRF